MRTLHLSAKNGLPLLLLLGLTLVSGCARHYVITLSNGSQTATSSKPKLKNGAYFFKDYQGNPASIPAGRVREISPASMAKENSMQFNPSGK